MRTDEEWLQLAVDRAVRNVADGGGPFGALVVLDGEVVGAGSNRVTSTFDPTAHAEVVAIRAACRQIKNFSLAGATLYTSCEPCPLCLGACLWARLDRVVYAADRFAAEAAGFDDATFHQLIASTTGAWPMMVEHLPLTASNAPFEAWLAKPDRMPY